MRVSVGQLASLTRVRLFLFIIILSAYAHYVGSFIGDKGWEMMAAGMWLGGKHLYQNIFEVNPPLLIWFLSIPAYLSAHTGLIDYHAMALWTLLVTAGSVFLCQRIMRYYTPDFTSSFGSSLFPLFQGFVFIVFSGIWVFGDREYIFMVLTFPYFLRWLPGLDDKKFPRKLSFLIGCVSGIGFCMKPYCLIVFSLVQLLTFAFRRSAAILYSTENLLIYAVGIIYLFCLWHFTPEYFSIVIPMALATYSNVKNKLNLIGYLTLPLITFGLGFADFRRPYSSPFRRDVLYALGLVLSGLLYALANNGWLYTVFPFSSLVFLAVFLQWQEFAWLAQHSGNSDAIKRAIYGLRACQIAFWMNLILSLCIFSLLSPTVTELVYPPADDMKQRENCTRLIHEVMTKSRNKVFGAITIDFLYWPHIVRDEGGIFGTRFYQLWMLPKFARENASFHAQHQWIIDYTANALVVDIQKNKPDVIFVEYYLPKDSSYLIDYMKENPAFVAMWKGYTEMEASKEARSAGKDLNAACPYKIYEPVSANN